MSKTIKLQEDLKPLEYDFSYIPDFLKEMRWQWISRFQNSKIIEYSKGEKQICKTKIHMLSGLLGKTKFSTSSYNINNNTDGRAARWPGRGGGASAWARAPRPATCRRAPSQNKKVQSVNSSLI